MYNWKSCKLDGVEINSLYIDGNLVWKKISEEIRGYYAIAPDKTAISGLNDSDFKVLPTSGEEIISDNNGILVVLINEATPECKVYDSTFDWSDPVSLQKGVQSTGETRFIGGIEYSLWYKTSPRLSPGTIFKINY